MTPLLIFGANAHTERVLHEIQRAGQFRVLALVDDKPQLAPVAGLPLYTREQAQAQFAAADAMAFVAGGEDFLNQTRLAAYMAIKQAGWKVAAIASERADIAPGVRLRENSFVDSEVRILRGANVGANSWILRGSELGAGAKLGSSCWVGAHCSIGDGASLGKNCTLASGVIIAAGVTLPAWSSINVAMTITSSPGTPLFIDPRFRAPVTLHLHD